MVSKLEKMLGQIELITSKTAISCHDLIGQGDQMQLDAAATDAMRSTLNKMNISGKVVIGEGERDKAPMLHIGEKVGKGGLRVDIASDPLEGTNACAHGKSDSLSVIVLGEHDSILHAPDLYMQKIAIGANLPPALVDLDESCKNNLTALARAKKCSIQDLQVTVLDRPRHAELIEELKSTGVKISLIEDGDVLACLKTVIGGGLIDMYLGIGGAPEGVIAAAGLKSLGGQMQGRLLFQNSQVTNQELAYQLSDLNRKYSINEMIKSDVIMSATWVTDGLYNGVKKLSNGHFITTTMILSTFNSMNRLTITEFRS